MDAFKKHHKVWKFPNSSFCQERSDNSIDIRGSGWFKRIRLISGKSFFQDLALFETYTESLILNPDSYTFTKLNWRFKNFEVESWPSNLVGVWYWYGLNAQMMILSPLEKTPKNTNEHGNWTFMPFYFPTRTIFAMNECHWISNVT